jgi:hypothetical protein
MMLKAKKNIEALVFFLTNRESRRTRHGKEKERDLKEKIK